MTFPTDPRFSKTRNPGFFMNTPRTVDQEWRDEGWYFVPPEMDSNGGPIFGELGENDAKKEKRTELRPPKEGEEEEEMVEGKRKGAGEGWGLRGSS